MQGDGKLDSLDTTGDGKVDALIVPLPADSLLAKRVAPPRAGQAQAQAQDAALEEAGSTALAVAEVEEDMDERVEEMLDALSAREREVRAPRAPPRPRGARVFVHKGQPVWSGFRLGILVRTSRWAIVDLFCELRLDTKSRLFFPGPLHGRPTAVLTLGDSGTRFPV